MTSNPDRPEWKGELLAGLGLVGGLRLDAGDAAGARTAFEQALAIARELAANDPQRRPDVVLALTDLQAATDDPDARLALLDEALGMLNALKTEDVLTEQQAGWIPWAEGTRAEVLRLIGKKRFAAGDLEGALAAYEGGLAAYRALASASPDDESLRQAEATVLGNIAFTRLFTRQYAESEVASRQAIAIAPDALWLATNLAHALMLQDRIEEADGLYLGNRGTTFADQSWEEIVLADFAELRASGIDHPHMAEIERIFASPEAPPAEPASAD